MNHREELERGLGAAYQVTSTLIDSLDHFVALVQKWNPVINVIGRSTEAQIWDRHLLDSVQLFRFANADQALWLDIGSGGGFPGIVIAILAREFLPALRVALVESDKRKAVFLSEAARLLGVKVAVNTARVEELSPMNADVVSARALAPLTDLCALAERHLRQDGICVFPKGATADLELEEAQKSWIFGVDRVRSNTDSKASVLCLRDLRRV